MLFDIHRKTRTIPESSNHSRPYQMASYMQCSTDFFSVDGLIKEKEYIIDALTKNGFQLSDMRKKAKHQAVLALSSLNNIAMKRRIEVTFGGSVRSIYIK